MTDYQCSHHNDSSGFTSGLLLGLVLGAAGTQFLNSTEKGQELLKNLKENAGDALKDLGDNPALADKIADLQQTMDKARETINSAAGRVANATEATKHPTKKNFFQKMGASLGK